MARVSYEDEVEYEPADDVEISVHEFIYVHQNSHNPGSRQTIGYVSLNFGDVMTVRDCRTVLSCDRGVMVYGPSKQIRANRERIDIVTWNGEVSRKVCEVVYQYLKEKGMDLSQNGS